MTNRKLFINAFVQADEAEMVKYKNKDDFHHEFSAEFEKKMESLIEKNRRITVRKKKISRAVIAAVAAAVIMFTGLMSVSASREKIIKFVENILSEYTQVEPSEDSRSAPGSELISEFYTVSNLPEGFKEKTYEYDETGVFAVWENSGKESITFMQDMLYGDFSVDNEHDYEIVKLNGRNAYISSDNEDCSILWSDGKYWFTINAKTKYKDYLLPMAQSVEVRDSDKEHTTGMN